jgi:hypothetical protein
MVDLGEKDWLQSYIRPVGADRSLLALMEFAGEGLISLESSRDQVTFRLLFPAVRPVTPSIAHQPAQPFSDPPPFGSLMSYAAIAA